MEKMEQLQDLLKQATNGESFELIAGRFFETDDGSVQLTQAQAITFIKMLIVDASNDLT